jgi:hypothetical protein
MGTAGRQFLALQDRTLMVLPFWLEAIVIGINLLLLPYLGLILLTALAALCSRRVYRNPVAPITRFLVEIPAHDEESGIAATGRRSLNARIRTRKARGTQSSS